MLVLQNNKTVEHFELGSLQLEHQPYKYETSKYDLTLNITEQKWGSKSRDRKATGTAR